MNKRLAYLIKNIEKEYYINNENLLSEKITCISKENLECNCITGIMLNYAGYVINNCFCDDNFTFVYSVNEETPYMQCIYAGKELIPITAKRSADKSFYLDKNICKKSIRTGHQTFVEFSQYQNIDSLIEDIRSLENAECGNFAANSRYYFEFWVRFLNSLRVKTLEESHMAFLLMAQFIFPNKTLKILRNAINNKNSRIDKLVDFLCLYMELLNALPNEKQGFLYQFSNEFYRITHINIAELIEPGAIENNTLMAEVIWSAYDSNRSEFNRNARRSEIKQIANAASLLSDYKGDKLISMIDDTFNHFVKATL